MKEIIDLKSGIKWTSNIRKCYLMYAELLRYENSKRNKRRVLERHKYKYRAKISWVYAIMGESIHIRYQLSRIILSWLSGHKH